MALNDFVGVDCVVSDTSSGMRARRVKFSEGREVDVELNADITPRSKVARYPFKVTGGFSDFSTEIPESASTVVL